MGLQVIYERSEQKKIGALQNGRILCYAYFGILGSLPSKKIFPPVFNFLLSRNFFQEAFASTGQWSGRPWRTVHFSILVTRGGVLSSSLKPISERVPNFKTKRRRHQNRCYRINQCANFQLNKFIVRRQPTHMSRKCLFIHGRRIALALKLDENDVTELNRTELN